ncbi:MAG: FHA domain-containing protein [Myxococcales bacterium]|nr:FHA domain-containing protein [Myxococcales bacterium]
MYVLVARDSRGRVVGSVKLRPQPQSIGRAPTCALILPSTGVSRTHAMVYLHGDGVVITDEGSANGVSVDGQLIEGPTLIDHTNAVQISSFALSVEPESAVSVQVGPSAAAMAQAPDTAEELDTRLEAHEGAASALASSTLQLVGRGGPYDATRFALDKALLTLGRVEGNDIVLEDPSISRRHAQLRLSVLGDRLTVLDLRSHNGSYVNGERVKRGEMRVNDIVRFGDLAFKLERERAEAARKKGRMSGRARLLLALSVLVVLVGGVAAVAHFRKPPAKKKRVLTPEERLRQRQAATQTIIDEAKSQLSRRKWSVAIVHLDKAERMDPLNVDIKKLRAKAIAELGHEKTYTEGMKFFALGNRENLLKAKEIFLRIPRKSVYYRDIRYKVKTINERVAEGYRIEGVSRCKARYYKKCHAALCKFFDLIPEDKPVAGEANLRRLLQDVEKRLGRRRGFVSCKSPRFLSPPRIGGASRSNDELLAARYKDRRVRQLVELYVDGKIDVSIKQLTRLRNKRYMRPHLTTLSEINRRLLVIRGKYQEGYGAYRQRKAKEAYEAWALLLAQDKELLPKDVESFYRREVLRALGNLYFELGDEQFKLGRYRPAAAMWRKGKEINPKHDRLLNGMLQLEKVAERLVREGRALTAQGRISDARSKLTTARDIVDKGRPIRKEAESALKKLGG